MLKSKLFLALGLVLVSGALLAACGDDDSDTTSTSSTTSSTTTTGATGEEGVSEPTASSDYDTFVSDCESQAESGGAPSGAAADACECVAAEFEAQGLSPEAADQLAAGAGSRVPKEFQTALENCLGELPSG